MLTSRTPLRNRDGQVVGLIQMSRDISEKKKQERLQQGQAAFWKWWRAGMRCRRCWIPCVRRLKSSSRASTPRSLILEDDGLHLRHGAAPSLPHAYTRLIDGIEIGPVWVLAARRLRRASVIVRDIENDPLWANFRDLAIVFRPSLVLVHADPQFHRRCAGTFALYSSSVRDPHALEMDVAAMATDLASIAIERAQNEERIRHMAHHDPLTGLPNRALFWPQFSRALHEARRESRKVTVTYIDLDNFKQINDGLGHAAGDEVLRVLALRITAPSAPPISPYAWRAR